MRQFEIWSEKDGVHASTDPLDRFICKYCGQRYVVPSLARQCEATEEALAAKPREWLDKPVKVERPHKEPK
jgi:hypothetical protein